MYKFLNNELIIKDEKLNIDINCKKKFKKVIKKFQNIKTESFYYKNNLYGPSRSYVGDILVSEGFFLKNREVGIFRRYYMSKELYSIECYKFGKFEGEQKYFYENKNIKSLLNYKDGLLQCKIILYYEDGNIKRESYFDRGSLLKDELFDKNQKIIKEE